MGSSKWLNLNKYNGDKDNTIACFDKLRADGYKIVATTPHEKDVMLDELPLDQKTALVFGTELDGLSDIAMEKADAYVKIPMYGFTESFNISVSAALSMFHLSEKIRKSDIDWQLSEDEQVDIHINWAKAVIKKSDLIVEEYLKKLEQKHNINYIFHSSSLHLLNFIIDNIYRFPIFSTPSTCLTTPSIL